MIRTAIFLLRGEKFQLKTATFEFRTAVVEFGTPTLAKLSAGVALKTRNFPSIQQSLVKR
jgi:hypothetical protein